MIKLNSTRKNIMRAAVAGASLFAVTSAMATEITVWCWAPDFNGIAMTRAAEAYAAINPDVTINIVDFEKGALEQKLQTQLAAGITDDLPDIVLIEDYGAQKYLLSFPGAFEPLNDHIDYSQFAPYKVALASVGNETYSLPFDSGASGLFYRVDYLEEAGFTPADLEGITWDRYIEIGKEVEAKTGHKMMDLDLNDSGLVRIMMQSAGTWYFNEDGSSNIADNAVFKATMEQYQRLLTSGIYKQVSGWNDHVSAFTSGEVASVTSGVWMTGGIKGGAQDSAGSWGVAPTPSIAGVEESTNYSNLGGSSWYVMSSSEEKAEAIDFLSQVWAKDVDFYQKILVEVGAFGAYLPAREGEAYSSSDEFFSGQPVWLNFSDFVANIPSVNYGIFTGEADQAVLAQVPALKDGGDVDEAIAAIAAQVQQQIQ